MRRRLITIAIFLLAGAMVNVAVAWGCAAWLPFEVRRPGTRQPGVSPEYAIEFIRRNLSADPDAVEDVSYWRIRRRGALFFCAIRGRVDAEDVERPNIHPSSSPEGLTPEVLRPRWLQVKRAPPYNDIGLAYRRVFAWGWPLLSLWCEYEDVEVNPFITPRIYRVHGGIETSLERIKLVTYGGPYARVLPLRPIWTTFAVNTLFYAALLWGLIPGPFAMRRLIRRRRGLCPKCAYPMGESTVCTECGNALPRSSLFQNLH